MQLVTWMSAESSDQLCQLPSLIKLQTGPSSHLYTPKKWDKATCSSKLICLHPGESPRRPAHCLDALEPLPQSLCLPDMGHIFDDSQHGEKDSVDICSEIVPHHSPSPVLSLQKHFISKCPTENLEMPEPWIARDKYSFSPTMCKITDRQVYLSSMLCKLIQQHGSSEACCTLAGGNLMPLLAEHFTFH